MRCFVKKYLRIFMTPSTCTSTCKNKPLSCSSLLARTFKLHGLLDQLCGCFFVRGIFSGVQEQPRRVRWRSWYTIYSCACVALLTWIWADTMASWTVEWSGHRERIDNGLHITIHTVLFFSFNRHADMARRIEEVRLNVFTVIQLKRAINDIWVWSLLSSSLFTLVVPCICVNLRNTENAAVRYQVERLHDSIDPDDMAFQGADFFTLNMSLLVSMAATVITYAVILQQTTQSLKKSLEAVV
ncbi:hypothetical protein MTO96_012402 [Rhipicephalus appendiculatus]